jgi:hypothetical protein
MIKKFFQILLIAFNMNLEFPELLKALNFKIYIVKKK